MFGGYGDDTYYIDNEDDVVEEEPEISDGHDTIIVSFDYTLQAGSGIEVLKALEGTDPIDLAGSDDEDNTLIGNDGDNILKGLGRQGHPHSAARATTPIMSTQATPSRKTRAARTSLIAVAAGKYTLAKGIDNGEADTGAGKVYLIGNDLNNELTGNNARQHARRRRR